MLNTLNGTSPNGATPRRRGRPRNTERVDEAREYTVGSSSSFLSNINGYPDLQKLWGNVDDIDLRLGWEAKKQMRNDPMVDAAIKTRAFGATARPVEVVPAPKSLYQSEADEKKAEEVSEFVRRNNLYLRGTQRDLNLTAFTLLDEALGTGHIKGEIVTDLHRGGVDDLKRVVTRIKSKNRYNSCFVVDKSNNVIGIAGYTGTYGDGYTNPFRKDSVQMYGLLPYSELVSGWELLPRDKWIVVTNQPPDDDSPLGRSLLRAVYTAYRNKRDAWVMWLKALDNMAQGMDVVSLPEPGHAHDTYPLVNGKPNTSAEKVPMATALYQAILHARQAGVAIVPHGTLHDRVTSQMSGDPFLSVFNFCDAQITMGILMQTLSTTSSKTGAYALGKVHQDVLDLAMRHDRRLISECITRDVFTPLVHKNFTSDYHHLVPSASFGEVELNDFAAWAEAFARLAQAGLIFPSQMTHIHAILGMPQSDMQEIIDQIDADQAMHQLIMEPQNKVAADGTVTQEPSLLARQLEGEYSKRISRNLGQRRAGRSSGSIA